MRVVYTGSKGGKYVIVGGNKKYINSQRKTNQKMNKKVNRKVNNNFLKGGWGPAVYKDEDE